jgi:hypothetical protein
LMAPRNWVHRNGWNPGRFSVSPYVLTLVSFAGQLPTSGFQVPREDFGSLGLEAGRRPLGVHVDADDKAGAAAQS